MSTYTSSLGLEEITPGDQAGLWGNTTNNNLALIDQAVTGVTPISFAALSGSTYTLTDYNGAVDEARSAVLNLTGNAAGPNTVVVPNKQKTYLVRNDTGQIVRFQTASPNNFYDVGAGFSILIFCNGNNDVFTGIAAPSVGPTLTTGGGTGLTTYTAGDIPFYAAGTAFSKLGIGPTNYFLSSSGSAPQWSQTLNVANGGTGQNTLPSGSLLVGSGTGAVQGISPTGLNSYVLTSNGSSWVPALPTSGGVTSVSAGTGISVNASIGAVTVTNTGPALGSTNTWTGTNTFNNTITSQSYNFTAGTSIYRDSGSGTISVYAGPSGIYQFTTAGTFVSPGAVLSSSGSFNFSSFTSWAYNGTNTVQLAINSGAICDFYQSGDMRIYGNNATKASGTTWANPSDIRLKGNVQNYTSGLSKLMQVQPKTWEYNGKGGTVAGTKGIGVVADEIEKVLPSTVDTYKAKLNKDDATDTDIKRFDATEITWLLVNAVKELKAELDTAKAEIAALKAK